MKSKNQIIIRRKLPIKIEKPFQCSLTFSYIVGEKKYFSDCFVFFSLYFLTAIQTDNDGNTVYVLGHKYILGPSMNSF